MSTPTLMKPLPAVVELPAGPVFPTCAPWCSGEHYLSESPDDPGICFAADIVIPLSSVCAEGDGEIRIAISYDPLRAEQQRRHVAVFTPGVNPSEEGVVFQDLRHAEAAAYAILAAVNVALGDERVADRHQWTALRVVGQVDDNALSFEPEVTA